MCISDKFLGDANLSHPVLTLRTTDREPGRDGKRWGPQRARWGPEHEVHRIYPFISGITEG